jgi:hypothetical protein
MQSKAVFIMLILVITFLLSCNTTEPTPPQGEKGNIVLSLADTSCTEAWVNLKTQNIPISAQINLLLNDSALTSISLASSDMVIYIDSLLPNKSYQLQAQYKDNSSTVSSNKVAIQTIDTTNHNFSWQYFTFGDPSAGSSALYDVFILNDTFIYAVGDIYKLDSLGQPDPNPYNFVRWNGSTWEIKQIPYIYNGHKSYGPIYSVFAFSPNDYWLGTNFHWNGEEYTQPDITAINGWTAKKMWGVSSHNLYAVGYNGNIAYYPNDQWSIIESGTNLNINDIWGFHNNNTNENDILVVGGNILTGNERIILQITNDNQVNQINPGGIESYPLAGVWFINKWKKYVVGPGLYTQNYGENTWKKIPSSTDYYVYSIRGNGLNDIMVCGGVGYVGHFNGSGWINYIGNGLQEINGNYYSVSIRGNVLCVVGASADGYAIALIGTR